MTEIHRRANARRVLSSAGYKAGGHFKPDGSPAKKLIGESVREHEHEAKPRTKLKAGGTVPGAAFGARTHKPRGMGMGKSKKGHTTVNVVVGAPHPKPPMAVPVPIGGPPPIGPGGPPPIGPGGAMPPGGLPGQMPGGLGANRGGRFAKGGKINSERDPIREEPNGKMVEGKLARGGKAKTKPVIDDGAGGGLGRLEKAAAYGAKV